MLYKIGNPKGEKVVAKWFDSGLSQTLYQDNFITFQWEGSNNQLQYIIPGTTPAGNWDWHNASVSVVQGNSTSEVVSSDDISNTTGTFYFSTGGFLNTSYNLNDWGARARYSLVKEAQNSGFPIYLIDVIQGDDSNNAGIIIQVINPE